ncbi:MAG: hypothetical protein LBJ62_02255 [Bifidobacteriaceae bacterium]|jgi:hypothetical protein|nr:hypothetical protein [Bifidobacteriaceae bacterium]
MTSWPPAEQANPEVVLDAAPSFRCGDDILTEVFRKRWETFSRHIARTPHGWVVTEFLQPGPGRAYGTINGSAGHHIMEGRWLSRTDIIRDYIRFWYTAPEAEPHRYSEWIAWAGCEFARLQGEWASVSESLPGMVTNFEAWQKDSQHASGLYWVHDLADAMECSISGDGLRPTINSYQCANAAAIADLARRTGADDISVRFTALHDELRHLINQWLFDPRSQFYVTIPMSPDSFDEYRASAGTGRRLPAEYRATPLSRLGSVQPGRRVRELIGFVPWCFGLPSEEIDPDPAVAELSDPMGFGGPFGLRTAERRHPRYGFPIDSPDPLTFICRWNGPSWPFATSQTLTALAATVRQRNRPQYGSLFLRLLRQYAASHIESDGTYWLDEQLDPDTGQWIARTLRRQFDPDKALIGKDYNHSTFADLVLSGLLGISTGQDGAVSLDPMPAASQLGWFEADGLKLAGKSVTIRWHPPDGLTLTTDGNTVTRPDLGVLSSND